MATHDTEIDTQNADGSAGKENKIIRHNIGALITVSCPDGINRLVVVEDRDGKLSILSGKVEGETTEENLRDNVLREVNEEVNTPAHSIEALSFGEKNELEREGADVVLIGHVYRINATTKSTDITWDSNDSDNGEISKVHLLDKKGVEELLATAEKGEDSKLLYRAENKMFLSMWLADQNLE
jgi:8-oxo-dGTP pyrophosphatase MutT (NUDIX family)